ncbi:hypothetical protein GCM10010451_38710 [Streptomyces virens]|uniref:Uncharacterized protein n=1 Tax=Streptomyces virens TaxID=285572 RepID=A0ABP6PQR3_9ACTN
MSSLRGVAVSEPLQGGLGARRGPGEPTVLVEGDRHLPDLVGISMDPANASSVGSSRWNSHRRLVAIGNSSMEAMLQ